MIKQILLICIFSYTLFAVVDMGKVAPTYPIAEQNMQDMMQDGFDKIDQKKVMNQYKSMIESKFNVSSTLPMSKANKHYKKENYVILDYDLRATFGGTIIKKAGEKIYPNLPAGVSQSICFIDAKEDILLAPTLKALGSCSIYMISNRNIKELYTSKLFQGKEIYPYDPYYEERFGLEVLPTKVDIYGKYFEYTTIDMTPIIQALRTQGKIL